MEAKNMKNTLKKNSCHFYSKMIVPLLLFLSFCLTACEEKYPAKVKELEYTVVPDRDIQQDLQDLIDRRKEKAFEFTFSDGSCLYIVKGYGKQKSRDYSIKINDFYLSEDTIVLDAELFSSKKDKKVTHPTDYPYIVIKTEYREEPVTFISSN